MRYLLSFAAVLLAAPLIPYAYAEEEAAVNPEHTWDLTELYPTIEDWNQAREEVLAEFSKIEARKGTLGDSADSLYQAYRHVSDTLKKGGRVFVYASLNADENLRESETQERRQLAQIMFSQFNEATAWMQPELIEVGREVIESYVAEDERLAPFAFQIDNSLRNEPHTLGDEAEQTLSYLTQSFGAPNNIYSLIANSDIPWPTITTSDGDEVRIDSQGYTKVRSSQNREPQARVRLILEQVGRVSRLGRHGAELACPDPGGAVQGTQLRQRPGQGAVLGQYSAGRLSHAG